MRANEKGIVVENLGAGGFIVGVIEPYERVSQKGSELAAGFHQLLGRARRFDYLRQARVHLQFRMTVIVDSRGPFLSLTISENWLGHLEFPEFPGQRKQAIAGDGSLRDLTQAIAQGQERVERNQALPIQNGPDSVADQFLHALGFRSWLPWTRKQIDDFVLRNIGFAGCGE